MLPKTGTPLARWFRRAKQPQDKVAAELGISAGYLSLLIAGQRQPSLPLAIAIAKLTGLSVDDLVTKEQNA